MSVMTTREISIPAYISMHDCAPLTVWLCLCLVTLPFSLNSDLVVLIGIGNIFMEVWDMHVLHSFFHPLYFLCIILSLH